jgi:hypothetical protein
MLKYITANAVFVADCTDEAVQWAHPLSDLQRARFATTLTDHAGVHLQDSIFPPNNSSLGKIKSIPEPDSSIVW